MRSVNRPAQRLSLKPLVLVLVATAVIYAVALAVFGGGNTRVTLVRLLSVAGMQTVLLCLLNYFLRGLRWRLWMAHYQRPLGWVEGLRLYLAGYSFTPTPGNLGEAARGLLLASNPLTTAQSLTIFAAERLADLMCLLLLCLPIVGWLLALVWPSVTTAVGFSYGGAVLSLVMLLAVWAVWRTLRKMQPTQGSLSWLRDAWRCLTWRPHIWFGLTLVAWAAQGLAVWLICRESGLDLSVVQATGFYAAAMIGGALSFLPAGLGGTEAVLTGLLVSQGASTAQALGVTVLTRIVTLWLAVALGLLALVYSATVRRDISFK